MVWSENMYNYKICNIFDKNIFIKQCSALEKHIHGLKRIDLLEDVDGSQMMKYEFENGKQLKVENNALFGVSIDSEISIEKYFN